MAQPSYVPAYVPVSVIDSKYMAPRVLTVIVVTNSTGDHLITDAYHNTVMFKVKPCHTADHKQLVLLDRNDRVIVMLREKFRSAHNRWNAFMGNSKDDSPNKQSSKGVCDFKINESWSNRNCSILLGDSSRTIAQMDPMQMENKRFYKDKFMVTIYPGVDGVDGAFVISLIAIIEAMKSSHKDDNHACQVNDGVATATGIVSSIAAVAQFFST